MSSVDDDRPEESFADRESGSAIGVRMVPIRSRAAGTYNEFISVRLARLDRMKRTSIRLEREMNAVPMDRCRLRQLISEMNDDVITFADVQGRTRHVSVVGKYFARHARLER